MRREEKKILNYYSLSVYESYLKRGSFYYVALPHSGNIMLHLKKTDILLPTS